MGYKVVKIARVGEDLERVRREAREELKEMMWREVWRDAVEFSPGHERIRRVDDWFEITVEI